MVDVSEPTPPLTFDTLDADASTSVLLHLDTFSLAQLRGTSMKSKRSVDAITANLLAQRLREARLRASEQRHVLPSGDEPAASFFWRARTRASLNAKHVALDTAFEGRPP